MAITYNNEIVSKVLYNGQNVNKVLFNGTVVWEPWIHKTGQLYAMTNNNSQNPFDCSAGFDNAGAYKVWDNNINTYWQHPNGTTWSQILFNQDIKVVTVSAPRGQHYPLQYLNENGQWVTFHAGGFEAYSWNLGGVICKGLRLQTSGFSIQVTEWYEKPRGFLKLTSNASPAPFTYCDIYASYSNGTPNYSNYGHFNSATAYLTVDENISNIPSGIHKDYVCMGYMCEVKWNLGVKIYKVKVNFQDNVKAGDTSYCKVVGLKADGSETQLGIYSLYFPAQNDYITQVAIIESSDKTTKFFGIRTYIYNSNPTAGRAMYIKDMDIIDYVVE